MNFIKRTTTPSKDNKYYNSSINPFVPAGYGMFQNGGNCTAYAWARAYEILDSKPKLDTGNAERWYKHTEDGYERSNTPRLGAIACWEGLGKKAGHVAIVENYTEGGTIETSNSAWKKSLFYMKTLKPPYYMGSGYKFQGFIYLPITFDEDTPKREESPKTITDDELLKLVIDTINGKNGNGKERVEKLGEYYSIVQNQVNLNYKYGTTNDDNIKLY